jgi:hypothetical protein
MPLERSAQDARAAGCLQVQCSSEEVREQAMDDGGVAHAQRIGHGKETSTRPVYWSL